MAVAAKVSAHDAMITREHRSHVPPHQMRLRKAVKEQHRRSGPGGRDEDSGVARMDVKSFKLVQHGKESSRGLRLSRQSSDRHLRGPIRSPSLSA